MSINHVLLEVYCTKNWDYKGNNEKPFPAFCRNQGEYASYDCLFNRCPFVDFTSCEHTLCYINEKSEMEYGILFDYEQYPDDVERWKQMSVEAVDRTYEEFMKEKEQT